MASRDRASGSPWPHRRSTVARAAAVGILAVAVLASRAVAFDHFNVPQLACRVHLDRTVTFHDPQTQAAVQFQASYRDICEVDHYAQLVGPYVLFQNGQASHRYYFDPQQQYGTTNISACAQGTDWPLCASGTFTEPDRGYRYPHVANAASASNVQDLHNDWWPVCASQDLTQIVSDPGVQTCGALAEVGLCLPSAHYFEKLDAPSTSYPAQHFYSFVLTHGDCTGCEHDPFSEIYRCKQLCRRYFGNLGFYCDRSAPDTSACVWRDRYDLQWRENCVAHGGTNCTAKLRWAEHGLDQVILGTEAETPYERKTPLDSCLSACGPPTPYERLDPNPVPCGVGACCLVGSNCCQRYSCDPATDPACDCFPSTDHTFCRCDPETDPGCTFNPACSCDPVADPNHCTTCDPSTPQSCCDPRANCCDPRTQACAPGTQCCDPKPPWVSEWATPPPVETQNAWYFAIWGRGRNPNTDFWGFLRTTAVNTDKPYDFAPICTHKTLGPYCNEMIPTGGSTVLRDQKRSLCKQALLPESVDLDGNGQPDGPVVFELFGPMTAANAGFCDAGSHGHALCLDTCYDPENNNGYTNPDHECGNGALCAPGGACHLPGAHTAGQIGNPGDCNEPTATCLCLGPECFKSCGNGGAPSPGEDCDPGTHLAGSCCLATCRFALGGTSCDTGTNACVAQATCGSDGNGAPNGVCTRSCNSGTACSPPCGGTCAQSGNDCVCQ